MKRLFPVPLLPALCIYISLNMMSCTQFFSTSLAPWAARDPSKLIPTVTAGNVQELIEATENNPDLALELLKGIQDAAGKASGSNKMELQAAALQAAGNASGLGPALLKNAGDLEGAFDDEDRIIEMAVGALGGLSNLGEASSLLQVILPASGTQEFTDFVNSADPYDLAMAAAVILASEAQKEADPEDYIRNFNASTPAENTAVRLAEAASDRYDATGAAGPLKDILDSLGLL